MKKMGCLMIIGITIVLIIGFVKKLDSDMDEVVKTFYSVYSTESQDLVLISDSISPNKAYKYFEYQFDNGGLGYSRLFWSVVKNNPSKVDLEKGLIPDGYKIIGWTNENELILIKWEPYYGKSDQIELKSGMKLNGVKIILKNNENI